MKSGQRTDGTGSDPVLLSSCCPPNDPDPPVICYSGPDLMTFFQTCSLDFSYFVSSFSLVPGPVTDLCQNLRTRNQEPEPEN